MYNLIKTKKVHNKFKIKLKFKNHLLKFGKFAFKVNSNKLIKLKQLEIYKFILLQKLKKLESNTKSKVWLLPYLNLNLTKLPLESRMGKGKGSFYDNGVFFQSGTILFEFDNVSKFNLIECFYFFKKKTSLNIEFVNERET